MRRLQHLYCCMKCLSWTFGLVAFVVFMGHWGRTLVASTGFALFMECFGLEVCGVHVCSVSEAFSLVFLFFY